MNYTRATLVADALSLGPHWVYNQAKLSRLYPEGIHSYTDPASTFHPNRKAGQFTHYGDQTLFLQELLDTAGAFTTDAWREKWLASMATYDGYVDGASKETLASKGTSPSGSDDLAGASRIGPLLDLDMSMGERVEAVRQQTSLTHGAAGVADAAEFFVRAVAALEKGHSMESAFEEAVAEGSYNQLNPRAELNRAKSADAEDFLATGRNFGLTCHLPEAFPLTLYFALRPGTNFARSISDNGLAGGDTSARAMILAILFNASGDSTIAAFPEPGKAGKVVVSSGANTVGIESPRGRLAGILEMPEGGKPQAFALFAHCFTCGKDFIPEKRITQGLAREGIATLRIDFSGIGKSEGEFADSSFITNLEDLQFAADWLSENFEPPELLIGHSLGGAAVLSAAGRLDGIKAVATIGAPSDPGHVTHLFGDGIEAIRREGSAEIQLAGRPFVVGKRFLDDLESYCHESVLKKLRDIDFLIMHSPKDTTVSIDNAGEIYSMLFHPKSFISLAEADHLLTRREDADYVARIIATWATRALA